MALLLAERARSECARPMRAVRATHPPPLGFEWNDGALDARSEGPLNLPSYKERA